MGQQIIGRPVSQRSSFGTLNSPSSATNPFSQMAPNAPAPDPMASAAPSNAPMSNMISAGQFSMPSTMGFQNRAAFSSMPRFGLPGRATLS